MQRLQEDQQKLSLSSLRVVGGSGELVPGIATIYRKLFLEIQATGSAEEQPLMILADQGLGGVQARQGW